VLAAADLVAVPLTRTPPVMWPFSIVPLALSGLAIRGGCRRGGEGPPLPAVTPFNLALGILYLVHWFLVIPWVCARMALLPKRLVWAKTSHLGHIDDIPPPGGEDGELVSEAEAELAAGGGQA
jgi:1,2-diacylglycerol 3-beta-glucosyltransferase